MVSLLMKCFLLSPVTDSFGASCKTAGDRSAAAPLASRGVEIRKRARRRSFVCDFDAPRGRSYIFCRRRQGPGIMREELDLNMESNKKQERLTAFSKTPGKMSETGGEI